ncbi:MAG: AI-2E family transporter [Bacillota bacterium]|jgi:predicted PurR-regulated permease PerM
MNDNKNDFNINDKKIIKRHMLIATYAVILFVVLWNLGHVAMGIRHFLGLLSPVFWGLGIAYVLNVFLQVFEDKICASFWQKHPKVAKYKRPLSLFIICMIALCIIVILTIFIIPQLWQSIVTLVINLPEYLDTTYTMINNWVDKLYLSDEFGDIISQNWDDIMTKLKDLIPKFVDDGYKILLDIGNSLINIFLGIIIAIYFLLSKEKLSRIVRKLIFSIFPEQIAKKTSDTVSEASATFSRFLRGQIIEAFILGILCFVCMMVMNMPYPLLISTIVGVTALIPILGAFLGAIPGAFIILIDEPIKALWFIIMIIILQQIEGNFIYPKVVGKAIGMAGIWVFLSVIIGGSLFGVLGILIFVPAVAVIYTILRSWTNKRLKERNIKIE